MFSPRLDVLKLKLTDFTRLLPLLLFGQRSRTFIRVKMESITSCSVRIVSRNTRLIARTVVIGSQNNAEVIREMWELHKIIPRVNSFIIKLESEGATIDMSIVVELQVSNYKILLYKRTTHAVRMTGYLILLLCKSSIYSPKPIRILR